MLQRPIGQVFFIKFLVDTFFCESTDTPVLDFWRHLLWVSKPEWSALLVLGRGICNRVHIPWNSHWCDTCWSLSGQLDKFFFQFYLSPSMSWGVPSCLASFRRWMLWDIFDLVWNKKTILNYKLLSERSIRNKSLGYKPLLPENRSSIYSYEWIRILCRLRMW